MRRLWSPRTERGPASHAKKDKRMEKHWNEDACELIDYIDPCSNPSPSTPLGNSRPDPFISVAKIQVAKNKIKKHLRAWLEQFSGICRVDLTLYNWIKFCEWFSDTPKRFRDNLIMAGFSGLASSILDEYYFSGSFWRMRGGLRSSR